MAFRPLLPGHFRKQFKKLTKKDAAGNTVQWGWGIHGQHLFIDRRNQLVIARFASQAAPVKITPPTQCPRSMSSLVTRSAITAPLL